MRLMGFNFNKIDVEKQPVDRPKDLNINTNIDVSEIKNIKSDILKTKEEIIATTFSYVVNYTPDYAKIELGGTVLLAIESKLAKTITKEWKNKKMTEEFRMVLFNIILAKSNVRALQLEEEMNLPYHIPMPSLKRGEMEEKKKK